MKVILQRSVDKLGHPGDIVEVADGYARNYLLPQGLAVRATKGAVKHVESLRRAHQSRMEKARGEAEQLAARLASTPIRVQARVGEEGKLFGSVTASDVAEAILAQAGVQVDRHEVHLEEPIRSIGTHEVRVHLFPGIDPVVTVQVEPSES